MKTYFHKISAFGVGIAMFSLAVFWMTPVSLHAQTLVIPCNGPDCDFDDLLELAKRLINYLVVLAVVVTAIVMAYAGFKLVSNQGNSGVYSEVKKMLGKVVTGFIIILAAWLIIQALTSSLLKPEFIPQGMS